MLWHCAKAHRLSHAVPWLSGPSRESSTSKCGLTMNSGIRAKGESPVPHPAVEHHNLIKCLDILSQAMWTLSSAARMMLDVTTPAVIRASAMRLVVAGGILRCSNTILRPQATWATIAIGPTQ